MLNITCNIVYHYLTIYLRSIMILKYTYIYTQAHTQAYTHPHSHTHPHTYIYTLTPTLTHPHTHTPTLQTWADGSRYQGQFLNDLRHGHGVHEWKKSGEKYEVRVTV